MHSKRILIVGEALLDYYPNIKQETKSLPMIMLGGVFHALRGLSSLGAEYALFVYTPEYLLEYIYKIADELGCKKVYLGGRILNRPNVMSNYCRDETSNQNNDFILYGTIPSLSYENTISLEDVIHDYKPTDIAFYPSDLYSPDISQYPAHYPDIQFYIDGYTENNPMAYYKFSNCTLFTSLSTPFVMKSPDIFFDFLDEETSIKATVIVKQNRGGSTIYYKQKEYKIPCFLLDNIHSVGVGDVYDVAFIFYSQLNFLERGSIASYISSLYSITHDFQSFKKDVMNIPQIENMTGGIFLSYRSRIRHSIYLAGPDFACLPQYRLVIDKLYESLKYHYFQVCRPIIQNGELNDSSSIQDRLNITSKDFSQICNASILIACILNEDSGTFAEIGYAKALHIPVILYNPFHLKINAFVKSCSICELVTLNQVINQVFFLLEENYD